MGDGRAWWGGLLGTQVGGDGEDLDRFGNVLKALLPEILETKVELAIDMLMHGAGDHDPARLGHTLQACGDVDPVAIDIVLRDDDVTKIDSDAISDAPRLIDIFVLFADSFLQFDCTLNRLHDARELHQKAIAHDLDDATAVFADRRLNDFGSLRLKTFEGSPFILLHQPREADDIRCHYRRQATLHDDPPAT
jgi:hypothetical protein